MFDDPTYPVKMGKFFSIISKPLKTTWPIVACAGSYVTSAFTHLAGVYM